MYYRTPSIVSIIPRRASVYGTTTSLERDSINVEVQGMPASALMSDLILSFIGTLHDIACDGMNCGISNIVTSPNKMVLTIKVPKNDLYPGSWNVSILYLANKPFKNRTAITGFEFFIPNPGIRSVKWCRFCPPCQGGICPVCIVNGVCVSGFGNSNPLAYSAALNSSFCSDTCHGVFQIDVENVPQIGFDALSGALFPSSRISLSFGANALYGNFRRIVGLQGSNLNFEIEPPPISNPGEVITSLSLYSSSSAIARSVSFKVNFCNDVVTLSCHLAECEGPSSGKANILLKMSGFKLLDEFSIESQILLLFGNEPANAVQMVNTNLNVLQVVVPACCTQWPTADQSFYQIQLTLFQMSDLKLVASTTFTYWFSPQITKAVFSSGGEAVHIWFNSNTNSNGGQTPCSDVLFNIDLLGLNPRCTWLSNKHLVIFLGFEADIVPGNQLQIQNIKSENGISDPASPVFIVQPPEFIVPPEIWLKGPNTIDPCTSFSLEAVSSSPRKLTYQWSCKNDVVLNQFLAMYSGSLIQLSAGTKEMPDLDKTYHISSKGVDFFGSSSEFAFFYVTKRSVPVPQTTFNPQSLSVLRNQPVSVQPVPLSRLRWIFFGIK